MSYFVWQLVRQLVYMMLIRNNRVSFHFWCRETLLKHQQSQNIMEMIVLKIFFLDFMSLLTPKFVKNSHI